MISSGAERYMAPHPANVSASASTCMPQVTRTPVATAIAAATNGGSQLSSRTPTPPDKAPTPAPTSGKARAPRATSLPSTATDRPSGTRVRKVTAAAAARTLAACISHARGLERRHIAQNCEGRTEQRQRKRGPTPFSQPQSEIQERVEPERIEHETMPGFRREVRRDQRIGGCRSKPDRDQCGRGCDEAVKQDDHSTRSRSEHEPREDGD